MSRDPRFDTRRSIASAPNVSPKGIDTNGFQTLERYAYSPWSCLCRSVFPELALGARTGAISEPFSDAMGMAELPDGRVILSDRGIAAPIILGIVTGAGRIVADGPARPHSAFRPTCFCLMFPSAGNGFETVGQHHSTEDSCTTQLVRQ